MKDLVDLVKNLPTDEMHDTGKTSGKQRKFMYKGTEMTVRDILTLPECTTQSAKTLFNRINKMGLTLEEAVVYVHKVSVRTERYKGKLYSLKELLALPECTAKNVCTLRSRLKTMPVEEAVTYVHTVSTPK